jgi:hypothetical protein
MENECALQIWKLILITAHDGCVHSDGFSGGNYGPSLELFSYLFVLPITSLLLPPSSPC